MAENGPTRREVEEMKHLAERQADDIDGLRDLFREAVVELAGIKATVRFSAGVGSLIGAGIVAAAIKLGIG